MAEKKIEVLILLFDEVEVLDFAGPFEVFSVANELSGYQLMNITTVSKNGEVIHAKNGLKVIPDIDLGQIQSVDILVIPGGDGSKNVINDSWMMSCINKLIPNTQVTMSVCSGARILAKLGYLDDKAFTTHQSVFEDVMDLAKNSTPKRDERFVDLGKIKTAAGVAAGIDLSLYVIQGLFGQECMKNTAGYMEYEINSIIK
ncbi:DJ-1/PfpI family protein [Arthrospiribacter ruber]|uniref:DJ-1/PfpI family protein n=1 Tax=Arthrospiribacter ruber TaxID=2487934 RepID=A0A951IYF4_9BACT|nr:DJ-1/PfpI family protein [Arthrospiribacter ruber]MBW3469430.1 DJ-1/PfpI family protein [Arthrospiribacter ruber]